jgi:hypothetical protein
MNDSEAPKPESLEDVPQDVIAVRDLLSKYADVRCPVHDLPPDFRNEADGSIVEHLCCEALAQILRELQAKDPDDG